MSCCNRAQERDDDITYGKRNPPFQKRVFSKKQEEQEEREEQEARRTGKKNRMKMILSTRIKDGERSEDDHRKMSRILMMKLTIAMVLMRTRIQNRI